jgi:hypothetical protein
METRSHGQDFFVNQVLMAVLEVIELRQQANAQLIKVAVIPHTFTQNVIAITSAKVMGEELKRLHQGN